jgi:thiol-disulfide isomerase/thioredoxin
MKQILFIAVSAATLFSTVHAQSAKDTTAQYYYRLATSKNAADKAFVTGKLYELLKSDKEKNWILAQQLFGVLKKKAISDSLLSIIKAKYPGGEFWRGEEMETVYNANTAAEKEAAYKKWIKKYPVKKFDDGNIVYDYAANSVARAFAEEKNVKKALYYANQGQTPAWNGEAWASVGAALEKNGYIKEAAQLYKKALNNSYAFKTMRNKDEGALFAASGYRGYCNLYAEVLFKQRQYDSALVYVQKAYEESKPHPSPNVNLNYANILMAMGKDKEAFDKVDEIVKEGQAGPELKDMHKMLYTKLNPSGKPYDEYMKEVEEKVTRQIIADLKNNMINQPAPAFVLKDVNGNTVSSDSLKGKVVILDFWATWCGPCKRSFPAMQMAVNKYKDNPNVKFLFIHTWEKGEGDATAAAKKYVDDNKYSFQVLMDLKDPETGSNNVVERFGISGIPTKFILDKNGNIRFRITGFSGSNEAAVKELSAMIDMVM